MSIAKDIKNKTYAIASENYEPLIRRMGIVAAFDGPSRTCSVYLSGADRIVPDVQFLNSYFPVVGDTVWVDVKGVDMMIIGSHNNDEWTSYTSSLLGMSPGSKGSIFYRQGRNCTVDFNFLWSGTSGTGTIFKFSVPFPAHNTMLRYTGSMHFIDDSTGAHVAGVCVIDAGSSDVYFVGPTGVVSGNFGMGSILVGNMDSIVATLLYQVAPGY